MHERMHAALLKVHSCNHVTAFRTARKLTTSVDSFSIRTAQQDSSLLPWHCHIDSYGRFVSGRVYQ
jgi:hypothetical protein